ncbi:calcium-binding protein, partial [Thermomonas alba]|uniref:calcium-binding protein n=1 Tax=Thermomonas alba TaxID=2888525 RepID=UPI0023D95559
REINGGYANTDVLAFGEGIAASDIRVFREGNDLVFQHVNGADSVRIKDQFNGSAWNTGQQIEQVTFADGTVWTVASIQAAGITILGGDGDDTLSGYSGKDILLGGVGNDTIIGSSSDELYGGEGDDTLKVDAYAQNAVFVGGKGNDTLIGGYFSDRYEFNLGDGQDTIREING